MLATEALQAAFKGYSDYLKEAYELGFEVEVAVPQLAFPGDANLPLAVPLAQQALDAPEVKAAFRAHAQAVN